LFTCLISLGFDATATQATLLVIFVETPLGSDIFSTNCATRTHARQLAWRCLQAFNSEDEQTYGHLFEGRATTGESASRAGSGGGKRVEISLSEGEQCSG
jgi:hypothetical protein